MYNEVLKMIKVPSGDMSLSYKQIKCISRNSSLFNFFTYNDVSDFDLFVDKYKNLSKWDNNSISNLSLYFKPIGHIGSRHIKIIFPHIVFGITLLVCMRLFFLLIITQLSEYAYSFWIYLLLFLAIVFYWGAQILWDYIRYFQLKKLRREKYDQRLELHVSYVLCYKYFLQEDDGINKKKLFNNLVATTYITTYLESHKYKSLHNEYMQSFQSDQESEYCN